MSIGTAVFVGDRVVVVDKPVGISSEDLAAAWQKKLVHRIDAPTSGLVVLADDARTVQRLQKLMQQGGIERRYRLVVHGVFGEVVDGVGVEQTITSRLVRDRGDGLRGSSTNAGTDVDGQLSTTVLTPLSRSTIDGVVVTRVEARLVTGRTHQIRIHMAEAGHMIVGERVYRRDHVARGDVDVDSDRLLLHAWRLSFVHPNTHAPVTTTAPLPAPFRVAGIDDVD